ncbi:MAG: DUF192 domain-containing protein [Actinomycetota bacterium]
MLLALVTAGCAGGSGLEGFPRAEVTVAGQPWLVAVAEEAAERARGLMGVEDLGALRGMLFVFPEDSADGFWMKDTPLALDIAFFAADGSLVDRFAMAPCPADPCPTYRAAGLYRYALEVPAGGFAGLGDLSLDPASLAAGG